MFAYRDVIKSAGRYFPQDQKLFRCMSQPEIVILELPQVFISKVLWNIPRGKSGVLPEHYTELMRVFFEAKTFTEFLGETEQPASVWKRMKEQDSIHKQVLDKEFKALDNIAGRVSLRALPVYFAMLNKLGGLLPDPHTVEEKFSAAIEFLGSSIIQVRNGANKRKNDPGMYVDWQLFWYLADPSITVVSNEDFSSQIRVSPQAQRIMSYDAFALL